MARRNFFDAFRRIDDHIDRRAFRPAVWSDDSALSAPLVERFNRDGVIVLPGFCSGDALAEVRAEVEHLLSVTPSEPARHQQRAAGRIKDPHHDSERIAALPRAGLEPVVHTLHGPVALQQSFILSKAAEGTRIKPWHQDAVYWGGQPTLLALLSVTDIEQERGCLWVVPGTHRLGRLFHRVEQDDDGWHNLVCDVDSLRPAIPLETRAGDLVLLHGLTVHASFRNLTQSPRITLGYHFAPREDAA